MKHLWNFWLLFLLTMAGLSCKPGLSRPRASAGEADFSAYLAIGNSLTAGYTDGGLYLGAQRVAFPQLLSEQMQMAGGGEFHSPFFPQEQSGGSGYMRLRALNPQGMPSIEWVEENLAMQQGRFLDKFTAHTSNLGIPGMRLDLAFQAEYGQKNPYFERLLTPDQVGKVDYFQFATDREFSFFSLCLGSNDALGFARAGGKVTEENQAYTAFTPPQLFERLYRNFVDALTKNGQKGVLLTLPDVTDLPFFSAYGSSELLRLRENPAGEKSVFVQDARAAEPGLPKGVRQAESGDLFLLSLFSAAQTAGGPLALGQDPSRAVEDTYLLTAWEVQQVQEHIQAYNASIRETAQEKGLALVDVYYYFKQLKQGIRYNGLLLNADFIYGGVFSLDGMHLTPKGNALITNLIIDELNSVYQARLPSLDVHRFTGVALP